ncbi:ABC transporter permease [Synechococcus sp. CS-1325]|uniref:ABC transporter permease n=1 Tax=unclassified Synechococcus TaxID=2626047 RepID=UPI0021A5EF64|nr:MULTISPECIES: ABC transporter permease [unclassified Synechococcus]MCT0200157.1 ABC transporter permease [Synechococcus sp. CS-1325]MCT0212698.1 ABC transporter permease [Synechococcus sp. CS-1326]MCT0230270.1 ABC transporter permease [Synechococcus sp. CS-1324]MCT0233706.1 ABC transporter permease [Synechococcus sp. CS-1327]
MAEARPSWPWALLAPGLLWLLLWFVAPLASLVPMSLSEPRDRFSLAVNFTGRLDNYAEVIGQYAPILLRSLQIAGSASLIALLIAYPLACWISFRGGRFKGLLLGLVVVPFFTSYLVRTIALTTLLADQGPVLSLVRALGLDGGLESIGLLSDGRLLNTAAAVVIGLAYNMLPYLVLPLVVSLESIEPQWLEAAADLHAGGFSTFYRVIWPLSLPGLSAGVVLSLIPGLGDVVNAQFLGGPNDRMIGNAISNLVLVQGQAPKAAALALLLMTLMTGAVLAQVRRHGSRELTAS